MHQRENWPPLLVFVWASHHPGLMSANQLVLLTSHDLVFLDLVSHLVADFDDHVNIALLNFNYLKDTVDQTWPNRSEISGCCHLWNTFRPAEAQISPGQIVFRHPTKIVSSDGLDVKPMPPKSSRGLRGWFKCEKCRALAPLKQNSETWSSTAFLSIPYSNCMYLNLLTKAIHPRITALHCLVLWQL